MAVATPNVWRAVLTDMAYTPVGELQNANSRQLSTALNRTDTATFSIRTDNPFADLVQSLECYLKLYRNSELVFFGLLQSSEETVGASGGTITATAAGPGWVFPHRYPVRGAEAENAGTGPRAALAAALIQNTLNDQFYLGGTGTNPVWFQTTQGNTGITISTDHVHGGTVTYYVAPYKPFSDVLAELSNAADGFDWRVIPYENWVDGALITAPIYSSTYAIGIFTTGAPLGDTRDEAIFEFGDGRQNIQGYTRTRSRDTQANIIDHLLNGQPEIAPVTSALYWAESLTKAGILEDIVQADLTSATLRKELTDAHLAVRQQPRDIVQWTPIADYGDGRLPRFGTDYGLGDFVTGRARYNGSVRFNGQFRVWGVEFNIDAAGVETPTVMLEYQA